MKKYLFAFCMAAVMAVACNSSDPTPSATVSGRLVGNDVETLYLVKASDKLDNAEIIDSTKLSDNGYFEFEIKDIDTTPRFYKLVYAGGRPVTLIVGRGDRITVNSAGDIFHNYTVEGSEESELIREFNAEYYGGYDQLLSLNEMAANSSPSQAKSFNKQIYQTIISTIQSQVRFVGSHQDKLASVYAMRQTLPEPYEEMFSGMGITNAHRNAIIEAVGESYPDSPYLEVLKSDIEYQQALSALADKITYQPFPEIELPDIYGQTHKLSSLQGKVILLYFWAAEIGNSNAINADLKNIYTKYHDRGLEIYQVSADTNSALWIEAVRSQSMPLISVCNYEG
ncbi:MAG: peroxiredoxin family protein, partial [Alistipes sp.]|nr:peroxiredoxin family protein [Alistipes sp.]